MGGGAFPPLLEGVQSRTFCLQNRGTATPLPKLLGVFFSYFLALIPAFEFIAPPRRLAWDHVGGGGRIRDELQLESSTEGTCLSCPPPTLCSQACLLLPPTPRKGSPFAPEAQGDFRHCPKAVQRFCDKHVAERILGGNALQVGSPPNCLLGTRPSLLTAFLEPRCSETVGTSALPGTSHVPVVSERGRAPRMQRKIEAELLRSPEHSEKPTVGVWQAVLATGCRGEVLGTHPHPLAYWVLLQT